MWEEDTSVPFGSDPFGPDDEQSPKERLPPPAEEGLPLHVFPQAVSLPNVVPVMNLYEAARTRAVADQQLSKLFNPEYYI